VSTRLQTDTRTQDQNRGRQTRRPVWGDKVPCQNDGLGVLADQVKRKNNKLRTINGRIGTLAARFSHLQAFSCRS
jgi:hypothetical protein